MPSGPSAPGRGPIIEAYAREAKAGERAGKRATEGQIRYASDLARKQGREFDVDEFRRLSFRGASRAIDGMRGVPLNERYHRHLGAER